MSLQQRLSDLITAIGADVKALTVAVGTKDRYNASTANQTLPASDTYLLGSNVAIPQGKIKVGTKYRCKFNAVKTNAGTATPIVTIRIGTAGAIADTSRAVLTFAAQTNVVDEGVFEIEIVFRAAGASAIMQALGTIGHRLAATGFSTANNSVVIATSAAFDITGANLQIGMSVNAGASSAWTISLVSADLFNLA